MIENIKKILKNPTFWLIVIIILGVGIRINSIPKESFGPDLKFFQDWTQISLERGISNVYNFYEGRNGVDYPPGYLYVLNVLGLVSRDIFKISPDTFEFEYFVKSFNLVIDLLTAFFILQIVKRISSLRNAVISFGAFFLNPYVLFIGAIWGQVDNLISFFTILAIYLYMTRFKDLTFTSIAVGLLTKFQIVIVSPLLFIHFLVNQKFRSTLNSILLALMAVTIIILPFFLSNNLSQVLYTYTNSTGRYPYISMNAYNLWWLFANPKELYAVPSDTPLKNLSFSPTYNESSFQKGELLSSKNLAYLMFFLVYIFLCINILLNKDIKNLFLSMSIGALAFFTLNVQMHDRYLFPFFALFSLIFYSKPKYLISFILLSLLGWVNLVFVFSPNSLISNFRNLTYPTLSHIISITNVIILLVLFGEVVKNILNRKQKKLEEYK